ncbi:MAG: high-potential iron-sulfur protein [Chryseosolibacter sp.]
MKESVSRRKFFLTLAGSAGALFTAVLVFGRCGQPKAEGNSNAAQASPADPCSDLSGVPENDIELRKKFAYVTQSPIADNQCNNCNLYLPPKEGSACGGCMLFKGPVYPSAYCTYWAPKV